MDEQLLAELYGIDPNEQADYEADDSLIKEAQAELVEAVADEAGIDLDEMDDDELEKFASYVLSAEGGDDAGSYIDDDMYAQADEMGRVMAHAYADEQMKIASYMGDDFDDFGYENALEKSAAAWDMMKIAKGANFAGYGKDDSYTKSGLINYGKVGEDFSELTNRQKMQIARRRFGKDGSTKRTLKDMDIRKRDYLRALVGRGTGYYDFSTAREINKRLGNLKDSMTEKEYNALMKEVRKARGAKGTYGRLSDNVRKNMRRGSMRHVGGPLDRGNINVIAAAQDARRGLMMRGAGKAALTAGVLGGLGYGAHRAMNG